MLTQRFLPVCLVNKEKWVYLGYVQPDKPRFAVCCLSAECSKKTLEQYLISKGKSFQGILGSLYMTAYPVPMHWEETFADIQKHLGTCIVNTNSFFPKEVKKIWQF